MIALMRKLIHNNFYKVFLWIFLVMMATGSGLMFFKPEDNSKWVLKVYNQTMSQEKFSKLLQQQKQQQEMYRQKGVNISKNNVQKDAAEAAVGILLSRYAVDALGMQVSQKDLDVEVQRTLQGLPAYFFYENGALNEEAFARLIAPMTIDDFVAETELDTKNRLLFSILDASAYVPQFELDLRYAQENANKTYSYIMLPLQKYLNKARAQKVSDETLLKYYKKASVADTFKTPERRSGTMWVFNPNDYGIQVTKGDIKKFYDTQKASLYQLKPAQMQVRVLVVNVEPGQEQEAKARIQNLKQEADKEPASFEELVRKFSDDKASAAQGGLTPLFSQDDTKLNKVMVNTAFEYLGTDGQISAPIKTDRGYELIQRVKKVSATYKDLASVEADIKKELVADKFKKRFAQDAGRVVSGAKYKPDALKAFIQRYHGKAVEIPLTLKRTTADIAHLFKTEEGRYGQFFDQGNGVILHCDRIERSVLPELDTIKAAVTARYYDKKGLEMMQEDLAQALKDVQNMKFEDVAEKYGVSVHAASCEFKNGKMEQSAILKEPEVAIKAKKLDFQGAIVGIETATDGIIVRLDSVGAIDSDKSGTEKEQLRKVLSYTKQYQAKEGFVASLYRIAKLNNKIDIKIEILQFTKEV